MIKALSWSYKRLLEQYEKLDGTAFSRSFREPYKLAAEWLASLTQPDAVGVKYAKNLLRRKKTELKKLSKEIEKLEEEITERCKHPRHKLYHSGFASSTYDSTGENVFLESVICEVCDARWRRQEIPVPEKFYPPI